MKKILLGLMVFSLIFAVSGIVLAQELERIPSPDQIKNFKMIKKDGNALFGVRINSASSGQVMQDRTMRPDGTNDIGISTNSRGTSTSKILEKILRPSDITLFEKIKQVGASLWGFRKNETRNPNEARPVLVKPVAVQCVKDAIDTKDTAVKNAIASTSQAVISAIDVRNACQKAALDKTTGQEQMEANKICVKNFQQSSKETNEAMKNARNEAWKNYKTGLKACSALQKENNATSTLSVPAGSPNLEIMLNDGDENN